jgi:hypothetical protein
MGKFNRDAFQQQPGIAYITFFYYIIMPYLQLSLLFFRSLVFPSLQLVINVIETKKRRLVYQKIKATFRLQWWNLDGNLNNKYLLNSEKPIVQ